MADGQVMFSRIPAKPALEIAMPVDSFSQLMGPGSQQVEDMVAEAIGCLYARLPFLRHTMIQQSYGLGVIRPGRQTMSEVASDEGRAIDQLQLVHL